MFDSDFSADLTIMEEEASFCGAFSGGGALPMITCCCPPWVKYSET